MLEWGTSVGAPHHSWGAPATWHTHPVPLPLLPGIRPQIMNGPHPRPWWRCSTAETARWRCPS